MAKNDKAVKAAAEASLGLTENHAEFLRSRDYPIDTVDAAERFLHGLSPVEQSDFFKEFEDWADAPSPGAARGRAVGWEVLTPVLKDKKLYEKGASIELTEAEAMPLVLSGAVRARVEK